MRKVVQFAITVMQGLSSSTCLSSTAMPDPTEVLQIVIEESSGTGGPTTTMSSTFTVTL